MPDRVRHSLLAIAAALFAASGAGAQSLKSLRVQDAEDAALSREIAYTNSVCGADMDARIDWRSAANWPDGESLAEACGGALSALEAVCRAAKGKARASSLSTFTCAGDGSGPSLSGGSFRYGASPGGDSYSDTKSYLDSML